MSKDPRFLVIDGYPRKAREELAAGGAASGGEIYTRTLKLCGPRDMTVDVVCAADPDAALPKGAALTQYDGIAWTGSTLTVHKGGPEVEPQIELARAIYAAKVPSFGSCWAAQVATVAAGGVCATSPKGREMAIARKIALTPEGRSHPLYRDKKSVFDSPAIHDDEITHLPPGGVLLATNGHSQVQAVSIAHDGGTFWGVQYHPEFNLHDLARITYCRRNLLVERGFFHDLEAAETHVAKLEALHQDPSRRDIAWQLGIDEDLMDDGIRLAEVRNWIEQKVLPSMRR